MASRKPNPKKSPTPTHTASTSKNACGTLPDHLQKEWFDLSPATSVARRTPAEWRCTNGHTWTDTKEHRLRGAGCPACAAANGKSPQQKVEQSVAAPTLATPANPLGENQVSLVVDTSGSMSNGGWKGEMRPDAASALNSIVDEIKNRAKSSGIPTTISLITFASKVLADGKACPADQFTMPLLSCDGRTALRDAIAKGIGYIAPQIAADGGPVTRLVMIFTDGQENESRVTSVTALQDLVRNAHATDMYTIAMLVPKGDVNDAARLTGVPADNIRGWNVASATGAADAGKAVSSAVAGYYDSRSKGVTRSTRFFVDASKVTEGEVARVAQPLASFKVWRIEKETVIREAVESRGYEFREGCGYYELSKGERLRAGRAILLQRRDVGLKSPVYAGEGLRGLLGIPEGEHLIGEGTLGDWRVYVQSTSFNRKLVRGTLFVYRTDGNNGGVGATWRPDPAKFKELPIVRNQVGSTYEVTHETAANLHVGSLVKIGGFIREVSDIQSDRQMVNARITAAPWVAPK
jgi:uncharacterized protein YegL